MSDNFLETVAVAEKQFLTKLAKLEKDTISKCEDRQKNTEQNILDKLEAEISDNF